MTHPTPGPTRDPAAPTDAGNGGDGGESRPVRETARHIAGRLGALPGALPRLAAAGAARARSVAGRGTRHESEAEREAHRRELALEAAESGERTDWAQVGVFSAGIAIGALIGAGAALLLAPSSGYETRTRLARRARHTGVRAVDRVGDLTDGARRGAKRSARRLGRVATNARWAAEDALERRRER